MYVITRPIGSGGRSYAPVPVPRAGAPGVVHALTRTEAGSAACGAADG